MYGLAAFRSAATAERERAFRPPPPKLRTWSRLGVPKNGLYVGGAGKLNKGLAAVPTPSNKLLGAYPVASQPARLFFQ